jgi:hypothetical protein
MTETTTPDDTAYTVREVVGIFPTEAALAKAVDALEVAGFDRAAVSVLSLHGPHAGTAASLADDPAVVQAPVVSPETWAEAGPLAAAVPFDIAGMGSAWAVIAAGGTLAAVIGATMAGGVVAAGLGALLWRIVARHHATAIERELSQGGLLLWVTTPNDATETSAIAVMTESGGALVHAHSIDRRWGVDDSPLHGVQPDPLLEHDPG